MMEERRWPTCMGLATLGPPKSITTLLPLALDTQGALACARAAARAFSAASVRSRLRKPGPAISTLLKMGSALRRAAIFSAMARGLDFEAFAAASAPLHWNEARSGRSD